ncbi:MAG: ROK family protein [Acidobacteriota bacterium]|nr:ROK family protein [Acidobacteriota bacterium]
MAIGLVEDNRVISFARIDRAPGERDYGSSAAPEFELPVFELPVEELVTSLAGIVRTFCRDTGAQPVALGMGFPGIIRDGIVEESPNLKQVKGAHLRDMFARALEAAGMAIPVAICNDADAIATGIAARSGHLERFIRVWTLGDGVGFGRYPHSEGPCEGGHIMVSLDPKESFCGCGGRGHLEGIMGHRAMRLRFLDLEPEEVFAGAAEGDARCVDFELLWHRALAAASATSIHLEGAGKFFITGPNSRFVKVGILSRCLREMVTMSPLQGSVFEVIPADEELAITGAAVHASPS